MLGTFPLGQTSTDFIHQFPRSCLRVVTRQAGAALGAKPRITPFAAKRIPTGPLRILPPARIVAIGAILCPALAQLADALAQGVHRFGLTLQRAAGVTLLQRLRRIVHGALGIFQSLEPGLTLGRVLAGETAQLFLAQPLAQFTLAFGQFLHRRAASRLPVTFLGFA